MTIIPENRCYNKGMEESLFKAYDIRGRYPEELNETAAESIACAVGRIFPRGPILIARDVRISSPVLSRAVRRGLQQSGRKVITAGVTTTPMFYFLVNHLKAAGGIMVTASHNPKEYNGLKIVREMAMPVGGREVYGWVKGEGSYKK